MASRHDYVYRRVLYVFENTLAPVWTAKVDAVSNSTVHSPKDSNANGKRDTWRGHENMKGNKKWNVATA